MRVCTLHLAITLGIRLFSREIIKKYASYCIIACVLTCQRVTKRSRIKVKVSKSSVTALFDKFQFIQLTRIVHHPLL